MPGVDKTKSEQRCEGEGVEDKGREAEIEGGEQDEGELGIEIESGQEMRFYSVLCQIFDIILTFFYLLTHPPTPTLQYHPLVAYPINTLYCVI